MVLAFGPWCETAIRPRLTTSKLLDTLSPMLHPTTDTPVRVGDAATGKPVPPAHEHLQVIGRSLSALPLAAIGGTASRYFHANRDERRREAAEKAAGVLLRVPETGM